MTEIDADPHGMRAPGTGRMVVGSVIGALAAYVFTAVGTRSLGDVGFAPIGALWTWLFVVATVLLVPLEQFATREASRNRHVLMENRGIVVGLVAGACVLATGFVALTLDRFFDSNPVYVLQMAIMMIGYGILFVGRGVLAGQRRFTAVGNLLAAESLLRLLVAIGVILAGGKAVAVGWSMVTGPVTVAATRFWRPPPAPPSGPRTARPSRFLLAYASGTVASQILLAASPLAVGFLGGTAAMLSVVFVTFTLFRAPLTLIFSLQGRLLSMFVRLLDQGERARVRNFSAIVAVSGMGLMVAAFFVGRWLGPGLVRVLFREVDPAPVLAATVAAGMVAASAAQITGQVLVAQGATGRLANAWAVGLGVAVLALLGLRSAPDVAVGSAFLLGEFAALCMVGFSVIRSFRPPRSPAAEPSQIGSG